MIRSFHVICLATYALVFCLRHDSVCSQETFPESKQFLEARLMAEDVQQLQAAVLAEGDAKRGAAVFYREGLSCFRCHDNVGQRRLGPNLGEKRFATVPQLIQSVLQPSATIREGFGQHLFQLDDGRVITGIIVKQDEDRVWVDRIQETSQPLELDKELIVNSRPAEQSAMPDGLVNQLGSRQEFLDLIAYLAAIAERGPGHAMQLKPINAEQVLPLPAYENRVDHAALIADTSESTLKMGQDIYRLNCATCHGDLQHEGSMPTSLRFASGQFKRGSDPFSMYQTLTHGFGLMIPQRSLVPRQKYAVIHYIRQTFVRSHNPQQYQEVDESYLASLPEGDTLGPEVRSGQPWSEMDYGPSFINTIEVPTESDQQNIAQKGIVVRLDGGEGGVVDGHYWYMFDHDTMRMSAVWDGQFIDYNGIHFNGVHGRHPKVTGRVLFANSDGPGYSDPVDGGFVDDQRVEGRDGKRYGPLPKNWAQYKGMYRYGDQTVVSYNVGNVDVLETPMLQFRSETSMVLRQLQFSPRQSPLIMQVFDAPVGGQVDDGIYSISVSGTESNKASEFKGTRFWQLAPQQDLAAGYVINAKIKTESDGTILARTRQQDQWMPDGQTWFIRNRRLAFDIGWVGAVTGKKIVADGKWHEVQLRFNANSGKVTFTVDGQLDAVGTLKPKGTLSEVVLRIGYTNENFPAKSNFVGEIDSLRISQLPRKRETVESDSHDPMVEINWPPADLRHENATDENSDKSGWDLKRIGGEGHSVGQRFIACIDADGKVVEGLYLDGDDLRLKVPAGDEVLSLRLVMGHREPSVSALKAEEIQQIFLDLPRQDLDELTAGGPANWSQSFSADVNSSDPSGGFITDTFELPTENPWNCRLRLSGIDFSEDGSTAYVCSWDGGVWRIDGLLEADKSPVRWKRIAAGLFQPLGIKLRDGIIFVTCRDQLVALHDLNGDQEIDWYQCFNNDHQVTPHFHEFAMGLQTDAEGNFYYAKSARHALPAVVPHHGTLLKVSNDGAKTEILANGFRAANGVCLNPDGSFLVTDQEGHWNPKNRINWVEPGQFYGNMFGYHDVTDSSDDAMSQPLCWITNEFDRSPAELLWIESPDWGPLNGRLLNLSYGYGKAYLVGYEEIDGVKQGGMCALNIPAFETGIMRGRFHPKDGHLYCCGLFAWSSTQQSPGGLYRLRASGQPFHLPLEWKASEGQLTIEFTEDLDADSVTPENFAIQTWDLKRSANYGSAHYNQVSLQITDAKLISAKTVQLSVPDLKPTWGMEIVVSLKDSDGNDFSNRIHNSIYRLGNSPSDPPSSN